MDCPNPRFVHNIYTQTTSTPVNKPIPDCVRFKVHPKLAPALLIDAHLLLTFVDLQLQNFKLGYPSV